MKSITLFITLFISLIWSQHVGAHANACHRGYVSKEDTIGFYAKSFKTSETLHLELLKARVDADNYLELGVLADIKGEDAEEHLNNALRSLRASRKHMDTLYEQLGELRKYDRTHKTLPEHEVALQRILKNHPPIERVSLTNSRFSNISHNQGIAINYGPVGRNFDELLEILQSDLKILQVETDEVIEAFISVMPLAKNGGFAAMVLSGRAPLPEKIMHTVDQTMVYVQHFNRACMTSISADMQVYPKGFEWLPEVNWRLKQKK